MDRFFCFLLRTKSVLRLKNRSRTGKTDDFSSPGSGAGISLDLEHFKLLHMFKKELKFIRKNLTICGALNVLKSEDLQFH